MHGVGTLFHGPPQIPHYKKNKAVGLMQPGHVFTVEPMLNLGQPARARVSPGLHSPTSALGLRSPSHIA